MQGQKRAGDFPRVLVGDVSGQQSIPPWIIYLYAGLAVTSVAVVITVLVLGQRKKKRQ